MYLVCQNHHHEHECLPCKLEEDLKAERRTIDAFRQTISKLRCELDSLSKKYKALSIAYDIADQLLMQKVVPEEQSPITIEELFERDDQPDGFRG